MRKTILFPLLFFSTVGLIISLLQIFQKIKLNYTLDLWEAGALVKAWQYQEGIPIYSSIENYPASWMYGPLKLYLIGGFFQITGINFWVGRLISLIAIISVIFLLFKLFLKVEEEKIIYVYIAISIIFTYDLKLNIFATTRPEGIPILCSLIFLIICYQALKFKSLILIIFSSLILVLGFFFKQTVAVTAIVPIIATILSRQKSELTHLFLAIIPLLSILGSVLYLFLFQPEIYHFMLEVPSQYEVPLSSLFQWSYNFLTYVPLLYLFLYHHWLTANKSVNNENDSKQTAYSEECDLTTWIFLTILVMAVVGVISAAKEGGTWNSLAYSIFGIYAFILMKMENFLSSLMNIARRNFWSGVLLSSMVGIMILLGGLTGKASDLKPKLTGYGSSTYWEVVETVESLPGKVVCPQDPTIPLLTTKKYAGRSIIFEYDASGWKWPLPSVLSEVASSNYVVTLGKNKGSWREWPFINHKKILQDLEFEPMKIEKLENSDYQIWQKSSLENNAIQYN